MCGQLEHYRDIQTCRVDDLDFSGSRNVIVHVTVALAVCRFLRATAYMLSAHMLSQFRPSVCLSVRLSVRLSVTRVDQSKTVEVRIMQFSPHSSLIPLVYVR